MMKVEGYTRRQEEVGRWKMNITSYRFGDRYICTVDNVEPGATLSRTEASSREDAERQAIEKARQLLEKTRVVTY
jgi:hypothetical protein